MTPTIQTEIELLQDTKSELKYAIMEKGVFVYPTDIFSVYPTRIGQISMTPGDKDGLVTDIIERDITSIDIPYGTTKINDSVFRNCTQLTSVTIPDTVTSIGYDAFDYCSSLTSITIPSSVTYIGNYAFNNCSSLTSITVLSETPYTPLGVSFDNTNNCPIYVPEDSVDTYKAAWTKYADRIQAMPQDNTLFNSIVDRSVTSINIPNNVTSIGNYAFIYCSALTSITIPNSVTIIGKQAFANCTSLTSINIPSSITSIGQSAFSGCTSLTNVTIPNSVTSIRQYAFRGCTSLSSVTCLATIPPTLEYDVFDNTNDCPIYVPEDSVDAYKAASGWSTYASRIQAIPS